MIEDNTQQSEAVESKSTIIENKINEPSNSSNNNITNESIQIKNELKNNQQISVDSNFIEGDSILEIDQSFEIISPIVVSKHSHNKMDNSNGKENQIKINNSYRDDKDKENENEKEKVTHQITNKPRSNSESPSNIANKSRRKSNSFLSRLQSSSEENENSSSTATNIPSSIASAFSSFSSFTSNFTLNPASSTSINGNNSSNSMSTIDTASISSKQTQSQQDIKEEIFRKKATLERKNLISLTKLIVKDLISSSLLNSRTINDDCHNNTIHLNNYFTLIDRVLKHGLKQNLLSNRSASLWNALDSLPKYLKESTLMSESVRSLANTKTFDGKIKAWMRLVMMQKKLPEYFNELLANKSVLLKDIYHDYAFMMNDEAQVFAGLIIGVNVIDCNFFVKDANFDLMDDIIDLSPYLRLANSYDDNDGIDNKELIINNFTSDGAGLSMMQINNNNNGKKVVENLTAVLDQKNYLEEWNKRLETTINDLKLKIRNLEDQNSKLEMEAKLNEVRISKLQGKQQKQNINNNELLTNESSNLKSSSSSSSVITDVIKNFIGGSDQQQSNNNNNNKLIIETGPSATTPTPSQQATSGGDLQNLTIKIEQNLNTNEKNNLTTLNDDNNSTVNDGINNKQLETIKQDLPTVSSTTTSTSSSVVLIQKDNELIETQKQQIEQQEKELINLRERVSILEASYRGSLDKIKILERDLDVQTSMNADKETTIKIYEKDIREKQAQVESLRTSLNDSKKLNSELNERLQETSLKLKDRVKSVSNLQANLDKWKLENKTLASRLQDKRTAFKSIAEELEKAVKNIEQLKSYNEKINDELRKERESGHCSSKTVEIQNACINELKKRITILENELNNVKPFRDQTEELNKRCRDYELSLEEIGAQLRESRLEVENLKENSAVYLDSQWLDSKQVKLCALCQQSFSVTRRKHHCRLCGNVFCQTCSDNKMELASSAKPVRVCDTCHSFLLAKFVKSSTSTT